MTTNYNHPYFSLEELEFLSERKRGKMSQTHEDRTRKEACAFIEVVGTRVGFPRASIATAQALYHRFHLFYPMKDFVYPDVTMAALFVSSKMHDTLKKPRDLLMVSYAVRFPELAAKAKLGGGEIDIDPNVVEADRKRLLSIERLILETICFNFRVRMPFPYVIKASRELRVGKYLTKLAWRLSIDSYRTVAPLIYPPHTIALGSILLSALLNSTENAISSSDGEGEQSATEIVNLLSQKGAWEAKFHTKAEDLEEVCHFLLDLLLSASSTPTTTNPINTSPQTPTSPSQSAPSHPSNTTPNAQSQSQPNSVASQPQTHPLFTTAQLTHLKIALRERTQVKINRPESGWTPRVRGVIPGRDQSLFWNAESGGKVGAGAEGGGTTTTAGESGDGGGTVRYLFGPDVNGATGGGSNEWGGWDVTSPAWT